jgi:hypothetical protein
MPKVTCMELISMKFMSKPKKCDNTIEWINHTTVPLLQQGKLLELLRASKLPKSPCRPLPVYVLHTLQKIEFCPFRYSTNCDPIQLGQKCS